MTDRYKFMYDSAGNLKSQYGGKPDYAGLPRQIETKKKDSVTEAEALERRVPAGSTSYNCFPSTTLPHFPIQTPIFPQPVPEVAVAITEGIFKKEHVITPAYKFLEDAGKAMKDRAQLRDKPEGERSMEAIVKLFNAYTGKDLSEADGWAFMIFLKMVRGKQGDFNADDYVDGAAYFGLLGECESKNRIK